MACYYPDVSGERPVLWYIDVESLPKGVTAQKEPSKRDPLCHVNLYGLTRGQQRNMVHAIDLAKLTTCDGGTMRALTAEDIERFPPRPA